MPSSKLKGRYLFGGSQAASIVPQAGSVTGSLTATVGSGGVTYNSNYVDLGTGSRFTTPVNSTPRDRTIILVGTVPVWEQVYDSDAVLRWPPTGYFAAPMRLSDGYLMTWPSAGFFGMVGASLGFRAEASADIVAGPYENAHIPVGYRDGTFGFMPQIFIIGHGPTPADNYLCAQIGHNACWISGSSAYSGSAPAAEPTTFGHTTGGAGAGSQAGSHTAMLGYAEYSYLTKSEAIAEATEMVGLLEGRGWTGVFPNPFTSE